MTDDAFHIVLFLSTVFSDWYIIVTFDFSSRYGFFGCFMQYNRVNGYDIVSSINSYCNRVAFVGQALLRYSFLDKCRVFQLVLSFFKFEDVST